MATLERQVHVHDMYILFCICILLGCMAIKGKYMTCTYCFVSCIWLCRCLDTAARHHHPHQFCRVGGCVVLWFTTVPCLLCLHIKVLNNSAP